MTPGAPLTCTQPRAPRIASRPPQSPQQRGGLLVLAAHLLLTPALAVAQVTVEKVELNVQLDPRFQAVYAKAKLVLRNHSGRSYDVLKFSFPAPLGSHVEVSSVWDREGDLAWRGDLTGKEEAEQVLLVVLRSALAPGKKRVLVVSYDVNLGGSNATDAPVVISSKGARLLTTGWYPLPTGSDPAVPGRLRLAVRLPKEWQVTAPVKLKRLRNGTALASYELRLETIEPGEVLLRAVPSPPP